REVELGREDRLVRRLDADVDVTGAARVEAGHHRLQPVATLVVRELAAAEAEARIVVLAPAISLPEVEKSSGDRTAAGRQDRARDHDPRAFHARLEERGSLRRARLEVRARGLGRCGR